MADSEAVTDERIDKIEENLAFQDRGLSELNTVVFEQQKQIDSLTATCAALTGKLSDMQESLGGAASSDKERPPHY